MKNKKKKKTTRADGQNTRKKEEADGGWTRRSVEYLLSHSFDITIKDFFPPLVADSYFFRLSPFS